MTPLAAFFLEFLVGPNKLDARKDDTPGGVFVERCRFLEETNCKVSRFRVLLVMPLLVCAAL